MEYKLWQRMFERCYSKNFHKKNPSYTECEVCERWHDFQNFCEDIQLLEGYNEWKNRKYKMHLDKDGRINGNKIYSKETCMFVTPSENNSFINREYFIKKDSKLLTGLTYIAHRIDNGYEEEFINRREFARKYNLSYGNITKCLNGKLKKTGGWKFKIK